MRSVVPAIAVALLLLSVGLVAPATRATAATADCAGFVNGENVAGHGAASNAIRIDRDATARLALRSTTEIGSVQVRLQAGPWNRTMTPATDRTPLPATSWSGAVDVADHAKVGIGLYEVDLISSGGCALSFWVNVTGASPASTPVGTGALVTLALGIGGQVIGIVRGTRGRGGLLWAILGGIPTGLGACVFSQQAGLTPLTTMWAMAWTFPPTAIGGLIQTAASSWLAPRPAGSVSGPPADAPPPGGWPRAPLPPGPVATTTPESGSPPLPDLQGVPVTGATVATEDDPPRTAFALIECAGAVAASVEFPVIVGLSPEEIAEVSGGALTRPESSRGAYTLLVQVVADGFTLRTGQTWRHELRVTAEAPYPSFVLHLRPAEQTEPVRARAIQAIFSVAGQSMGLAVRPVAVVRDSSLLGAAPAQPPAEGLGMAIPMNEPAADLTVRIQRGDGGILLWTFDSPYPDIDMPDEPQTTDIDSEPDSFLQQLVEGVGAREGQPGLAAYLIGTGRTIADKMPLAFWDILKQAADHAAQQGRVPSVFILSQEPYVPWELAVVEPSLSPDPATPLFLGAQACVGRWVLGNRRPTLPPPSRVDMESMAVVSGEYSQAGWSRLLEAEAEAAALTLSYGATAVAANTTDVLQCLGGLPPVQALHFAVHGVYDPNSVQNGIVLTDGLTLDPQQVKGILLGEAPFVFLNACQVGSANRVLGDYGGMAAAFLYAGASGVVAPLWSIDDILAREIALRFYETAFTGAKPSEILRQERGRFGLSESVDSATCLAYVWYGHPSFRLSRVQTPAI